jgi:hypothetical protein
MRDFLTAEFTTLSPSGYPATWPVLPSLEARSFQVAVASSIGLPQKTLNIRRDPRVGLLYSDPTGSGLTDPPKVRIEGVAEAEDHVLTSLGEVEDRAIVNAFRRDSIRLLRRQPAVGIYTSNRLLRSLMDWYFLRLLIVIKPTRVSWSDGDGWESVDVA